MDVTYTFSSATNNPGNGNNWYSDDIDAYTSWSATDGTNNNTQPKYYSTGSGLRVYNGGTFSISSSKTIKTIKLTFSATTTTFSSSNTDNPQSVSPNATSYEWEVSQTCRLQKIEIDYAVTCTQLTMSSVTAVPGNGSISLSWSAVSNADSYSVGCVEKGESTHVGTGTGSVNTTSCTISGLTNGTEYTWSVEPVGSGTYCSSNTPETGDATPNVYYTVTWKCAGSADVTTSVVSGQKPTFPDTPTSCDTGEGASTTFYGWSTSSWSGKINDISGKTIYTSASSMPTVTGNGVVYHAVFCKSSGGSVTLTGSDFHNQLTGSYADQTITKTIGVTNYTFNLNACEPNNTGNKCQMRDNTTISYIQIPSLPGVITRLTATSFTNASDDAYTGTLHFKSSKKRGNANTDDIARVTYSGDGITALDWDMSSDNTTATTGYFVTSAGLRMSDFTVYYGSGGTNYMTSCCTELGTINGSII